MKTKQEKVIGVPPKYCFVGQRVGVIPARFGVDAPGRLLKVTVVKAWGDAAVVEHKDERQLFSIWDLYVWPGTLSVEKPETISGKTDREPFRVPGFTSKEKS